MATECIFCEIIARRAAADIVHEDELTIAVVDLRQHNPGHVLVIPKAHINDVRGLDERTGSALMNSLVRIAKAVDSAFPNEGMTVWHSIGPAAFQEVPHMHLHVHPRRLGGRITACLSQRTHQCRPGDSSDICGPNTSRTKTPIGLNKCRMSRLCSETLYTMSVTVQCSCGAVQIQLTGRPVVQYFCHCDDCQTVHGKAYACMLYPTAAASVESGETEAFTLKTSPRTRCKSCETYLFAEVPGYGVRGVNADLLPPGSVHPGISYSMPIRTSANRRRSPALQRRPGSFQRL